MADNNLHLQRWPEVRALFELALSVPRAAREAFVRERGDAWLAERVLGLLKDEATQLDDTLGASPGPSLLAMPNLSDYRILRPIGQGGMGVVYLAEQLQPRRQVAIKLLTGALTDQTLARFRREADLLARLSHPGIAQVFELGQHDTGTPYLVMEYVDGQHLGVYVRVLDRAGRLKLLARIADAVEHAHSRGVVHRDLKPSNILVGKDGQPKILDFGIGFLFDGESLTATGAVLGTPAYMSPEQAQGREDVDARADVYALGAIGYELLTGRVPVPVGGLTPLQAVQRVIQDTPLSIGRVDASLRGDLEVVIDTALARESSLRYASAGAFADDLRRYLEREPIHARRASPWQRLRLFAKRHPIPTALAGGLVLSLVLGTAVSLRYASHATQERDRAQLETQRAEAALRQAQATLDALNQVFSAGNPSLAGKPDVPFREALASAAQQLANVAPATRADVLFAIAQAQLALGDDAAAASNLDAVQSLAGEIGNEALLLRAGLRRAQQMTAQDSTKTALEFIQTLQARPSLLNEPLIRAGLHLQASAAQWSNGYQKAAERELQSALTSFPSSVEAKDAGLEAELQIAALVRRSRQVSRADDSQAMLPDLVADIENTLPRVTQHLGSEHPDVVRLRVAREAMVHIASEGEAWAPALIDEIATKQIELGLTHPAVLARISAAQQYLIMSTALRNRLTATALPSIRAQPITSRLRMRQTRALFRQNDDQEVVGDLQQLSAAQCQAAQRFDFDCLGLELRIADAAIRKQDPTGLARLRAAQQRAEASGDRVLRVEAEDALATAYVWFQQYDQAADQMDRVIALLETDPELSEASLDRLVLDRFYAYFPHHCERLLVLLRPREKRLQANPFVMRDVLAYSLSSCEVLTGGDPEQALARLDEEWRVAEERGSVIEARALLADGYMLIYDHLKRDDDFARWAHRFGEMLDTGFYDRDYPLEDKPHLLRALKLLGTSPEELRARKP